MEYEVFCSFLLYVFMYSKKISAQTRRKKMKYHPPRPCLGLFVSRRYLIGLRMRKCLLRGTFSGFFYLYNYIHIVQFSLILFI